MNTTQFPMMMSLSRILAEDVSLPELRHTVVFMPQPYRKTMGYALKLIQRLLAERIIRRGLDVLLSEQRSNHGRHDTHE